VGPVAVAVELVVETAVLLVLLVVADVELEEEEVEGPPPKKRSRQMAHVWCSEASPILSRQSLTIDSLAREEGIEMELNRRPWLSASYELVVVVSS